MPSRNAVWTASYVGSDMGGLRQISFGLPLRLRCDPIRVGDVPLYLEPGAAPESAAKYLMAMSREESLCLS